MSTLSSTPRGTSTGTPSLTVPATQNTAPVIKFRCLFTHDVRRKAKRWHDGFLRYHTFNKRVMVYDNTGYFIGDLHWRQDEGIQDGDELELDKGVLIQVCEPVERTETDLSTLYGNKRKSQESPPRAPGPSTPSFRSVVASQQQPRSLNDVLGIRKTSIGPPLSPYAERRKQEGNQLGTERTAKRQKTTPSNVRVGHNPPVLIDPPGSSTEGQANKSPAPSRPLPAKSGSGNDAQRGIKSHHNAPSNAATSSRSSAPSSESPMSTLRLSTSQPRKKLMYQALLPNQPAEKVERPPPAQDKKIIPTQSRSHEVEPLQTQDPTSTNMDFIPTESTMFVLEEMVDVVPESPPRMNGGRNTFPYPAIRPTNTNGISRMPALLTSNQSIKTPGIPLKPPSKGLRKTLSDPTALATSNPAQYPIEENPPEQGPWTSEALDLFDFWPPGRAKPG